MKNTTAEGKVFCDLLQLHIAAAGLPVPEREYQFSPNRRWRADFAWPWYKLLVEVDGGRYTLAGGRHASDRDLEKGCWAAILGYRVMHFSPGQVEDGRAIELLKEVFKEA